LRTKPPFSFSLSLTQHFFAHAADPSLERSASQRSSHCRSAFEAGIKPPFRHTLAENVGIGF
jgi:hypothetical protein